jgi:general secretion pathway protein B
MSFILDALKKSDSERQRQSGPALLEVRHASPRSGLPVWAIVLGALLLVNIVAFGWFLTRSRASVTAPSPTAVASAPPASAPPATALPTPAPIASASPETPAAVLPPQHSLPPAPAASEAENPADYEEALPEGSVTARRSPAISDGNDAATERDFAPTIDKLPASVSTQLPQLHLDMLVYATRASDRFVLVNMQRLHEGDATREGVRVETITPTGVVMSFRGTRFLLERD